MRKIAHIYSFPTIVFRDSGTTDLKLSAMSRYRGIKTLEYNGIKVMGTWKGITLPDSATDTIVRIEAGKERRPDLACKTAYATTDLLWWAIALRNRVVDAFDYLKAGVVLSAPNLSALFGKLV